MIHRWTRRGAMPSTLAGLGQQPARPDGMVNQAQEHVLDLGVDPGRDRRPVCPAPSRGQLHRELLTVSDGRATSAQRHQLDVPGSLADPGLDAANAAKRLLGDLTDPHDCGAVHPQRGRLVDRGLPRTSCNQISRTSPPGSASSSAAAAGGNPQGRLATLGHSFRVSQPPPVWSDQTIEVRHER